MPDLGFLNFLYTLVPSLIAIWVILSNFHIAKSYEEYIVLGLGKYIGKPKGAGPFWTIPFFHKV